MVMLQKKRRHHAHETGEHGVPVWVESPEWTWKAGFDSEESGGPSYRFGTKAESDVILLQNLLAVQWG
ncbi:MAG: hypothetical protein AB7D01_04205 [Methanoculleus sp.]|jgi:hypothetical protein